MRLIFTILLLSAISLFANAQKNEIAITDTTPFYNMSLEELMNVNVTVASQLPMSSREAPGIVTILNSDEIARSGAGDLMQLLQLVPGFDFGVDVEGVIGIGVRGNWAHEGKVLMLWDGMDLNEDLYSTLQFGTHYPLDQIKKIEIIRGPGSAMYGGNAEYAVINITTINNTELNGVSASVVHSMMSETFGSRGAAVAAGKSFGDMHINLSTLINQSNRSQQIYMDNHGSSYDMKDESRLNDVQYRMDFTFKGFSLTGMCENYSVDQRDGYDAIYVRPYKTNFNAGHLSTKYEWRATDKLTVTPGFRLKMQDPWSYRKPITDDTFEPFSTSINKKEYYINAVYDPTKKINLIGGLEYYNQVATQNFDSVYFTNGNKNLYIDNYAAYVQSIIKVSQVNVILGSRYNYNPAYGSSFVPRVGLTKVWPGFHIKTLYSLAFRSPSAANINASAEIHPENTSVIELETGVRLFSNTYLTANIYDITTLNPIIYYYDENDDDIYINESSTGTRGFEIEYKWKMKGWYTAINYAHYCTIGHRIIPIYGVPGKDDKVLAFPEDEVAFNANVQLSKRWNINPSVTYLSERYSYHEYDDGTIGADRFKPAIYGNIAINAENIFCKGFVIQASCINITDRDVHFIQPYNGNHAEIPGQGRQFQLKFKYNFSFKEN